MSIVNAFGGTTSPGGSNREVQINDNGSFGASANFKYNANNDIELASGSIGVQGAFSGFASGSGMSFDYASGIGKIISSGPDASTVGSLEFIIKESDGGGVISPLEINNTGMTVANKSYVVKGTLDGSMGTASFGAFDYATDGCRIISNGPNSTTKGKFTIISQEQDNGASTAAFVIDASGNISNPTGQLHAGSDKRLKKYIKPLDSVWDLVKSLNPVKFQWRSAYENKGRSNTCFGFIAQEIEPLIPEIVLTGGETDDSLPNDLKHLCYIEMIPILCKAIQELQDRVIALEGG